MKPNPETCQAPGVKEMVNAILELGWKPVAPSLWKSPDGQVCMRGPALVYHALMGYSWPCQSCQNVPQPNNAVSHATKEVGNG